MDTFTQLILSAVRLPFQQAYWIATVLVVAVVFWRGGRVERVGAALWLMSSVLSVFVHGWTYLGVWIGVLALDTALFIALYALALSSPRWWLIVVCAFVLLLIIGHVVPLVDGSLWKWAYVTMHWLFSAGGLLALLGAAWEGRWALVIERETHGTDPARRGLERGAAPHRLGAARHAPARRGSGSA